MEQEKCKIYFQVQDIKKISCGHKTYYKSVEKVTNYKAEEVNKAIKHFKKRAHNEIIMHMIEYFDDIPYVKDISCFGEEIRDYDKKYVLFKNCNVKFEI